MDKARLIKRVDDLLAQCQLVRQTERQDSAMFGSYVDHGQMMGLRAATLSFIELVFGKEHSYYKEYNSRVLDSSSSDLDETTAIISSIKYEIENDWLVGIEQLVSANIFGDFLEMADHLLTTGYKDAAAVMTGSTLEEHIRLLCNRNGLATESTNTKGDLKPKKADTMNADLKKANVYTSIEQKNITAWLDLRNKAAHGQYTEYTKQDVAYMLQGVSNFISNYK